MSEDLQRKVEELTAALARAQRTITVGELTQGFAHEMKNALTVVQGFAELARTAAERGGPDDPERVVRYVRELERESRRTVTQLQSFLAYASGAGQPRRPSELDALAEEALSMVRPMARMRELLVEHERGGARAMCDPFSVRQALLNLLLNALGFARGRIVVSTAAVPGGAEVRVADDGPGVPAADRERIFERFFTTRPGGNGLGLSFSRQIARDHGGALTVQDTAGGGATFVLRLPAA